MGVFNLYEHATGRFMRTVTGDSFSRAIETEVSAGRSLAKADLTLMGRNGDPTQLNLKGGTFTSVKMDGVNLTGSDLTSADFTGASLKASVLKNTKQQKATFTNANETGSDQTGREGR